MGPANILCIFSYFIYSYHTFYFFSFYLDNGVLVAPKRRSLFLNAF